MEGALGIAEGIKGQVCAAGDAFESDAGPVVDGGDQDAVVLLGGVVLAWWLLERIRILVLVLLVG